MTSKAVRVMIVKDAVSTLDIHACEMLSCWNLRKTQLPPSGEMYVAAIQIMSQPKITPTNAQRSLSNGCQTAIHIDDLPEFEAFYEAGIVIVDVTGNPRHPASIIKRLQTRI